MCNMGIEMGAKAMIMEADAVTGTWLAGQRGTGEMKPVRPDGDAEYCQVFEFRVDNLEPQIAKPHTVDNVAPIREVLGTPIHEVVIGTCTNGRLEDLDGLSQLSLRVVDVAQVVPAVGLREVRTPV